MSIKFTCFDIPKYNLLQSSLQTYDSLQKNDDRRDYYVILSCFYEAHIYPFWDHMVEIKTSITPNELSFYGFRKDKISHLNDVS